MVVRGDSRPRGAICAFVNHALVSEISSRGYHALHRLFTRDRQERRRGKVALYVKEGLDCTDHSYGDESFKCLWARIRGGSKGDVVVEVCYRLPNQDK